MALSPDFQIFASGGEGIIVREHDSQGFGRTSDSSGVSDPNRPLPDQTGLRSLSDRLRNTFGFPASVSLGSLPPPVIPDSLTTLSQYLSHMSHEFDIIVREGENNAQAAEAHSNGEIGSCFFTFGFNTGKSSITRILGRSLAFYQTNDH